MKQFKLMVVAVAAMGVAVTAAVAAPAGAVSPPPTRGSGPSPAAAGPTHAELMAPYLTGPVRSRTTTIDLRTDRILVVAQGRDLNTSRAKRIEEANFGDKLTMLTNRNIPLTGINVYDWTGDSTPVISGNTYATWAQLGQVLAGGGAVTSEGYAHERLDTLSAKARWQDTCGVLAAYRSKGMDASSLYAYSGGPISATHQKQLVGYCYAFGRQYSTQRNRMTSLGKPWVLRVRSINGGCVTAVGSCFGSATNRGYDSLTNLRSTLVPAVGEVAVLQYYHLMVGRGPTWDCTSPVHQTGAGETYCLSDVMAFLDGLPSDVKVATVADLATAVGRSSQQLPGITLAQYLASQAGQVGASTP